MRRRFGCGMVDRRAGCFSDSPIRGTQRQFRQAEGAGREPKGQGPQNVRVGSGHEADKMRTREEKRRREKRRRRPFMFLVSRFMRRVLDFCRRKFSQKVDPAFPGPLNADDRIFLLKVAALREADAIPEVWIDHGIQAIVHHGEGNGGSKPIANRTAYFTSVLAGEAAKCGSALGPLLASVDVPPHLLDRRAKGGETA